MLNTELMSSWYHIVGFSHEDFNLAVWSIRNIKIHEKFHQVKIVFHKPLAHSAREVKPDACCV